MSIFSKNNKKKIALALACASIFGGKSSLAAQNTGKVGGEVVSSKKMGNLTKGLIIGGSILGGAGLIYEILGDTVIYKAPTIGKKLFLSLKVKMLTQNVKNTLKKFRYIDEIEDESLKDKLYKINFTVKDREVNRVNMIGEYLKSKNEFDGNLSHIQVVDKLEEKATDEGIKALFLTCDIKLISDYLNNISKFNLKNDSLILKVENEYKTFTLTMKEKKLEITCAYDLKNPFGNDKVFNYKIVLKI